MDLGKASERLEKYFDIYNIYNTSRNIVYSNYSLVEVNRFSTKLMGIPNEGWSKKK